jgi:hypothetical protein
MENQSLLERTFLNSIVGITIITFAGLSRYVMITMGVDDFTALVVFIICILIGVALYSLIKLILTDILNIIFRKNNKKKVKQNIEVINKVKLDDNEELSKIIDKNHQEKARIEKQKLEKAIQYSKEMFASYTRKEDLIKLCEYIEIYSKQQNFNVITPIQVEQLKYFDVYHFGWNIWNYFNVPNNRIPQIKIAELLKNIFKELLKDVEIKVIKSHLKTDPKKGIIKIEENIINVIEN